MSYSILSGLTLKILEEGKFVCSGANFIDEIAAEHIFGSTLVES